MIRNFFKLLLYPLMGNIRSKPKVMPSPPLQSDDLHVFAGAFHSELAATDYALGTTRDGSLSADLGGAVIGADDVEVIFGTDRIAATRPMLLFKGAPRDTGNATTLLLLSDRGYIPDALAGDSVAYVGKCSVT